MKFKIAAKPTFTHAVAITTADGQKGEIAFTFRYIKPADYPAFVELIQGKTTRDILAGVIQGWDGVTDADGNDLAYSEAQLDALLGEFYVADTIFKGFLAGLRGAGEKN